MASLIHFIILVTRQLLRTDSIIRWPWPWCQQRSPQLGPLCQAARPRSGAGRPSAPPGSVAVALQEITGLLSPTQTRRVLVFPHSVSSQCSPLSSRKMHKSKALPGSWAPTRSCPLLLLAAGNALTFQASSLLCSTTKCGDHCPNVLRNHFDGSPKQDKCPQTLVGINDVTVALLPLCL